MLGCTKKRIMTRVDIALEVTFSGPLTHLLIKFQTKKHKAASKSGSNASIISF